MPLTPEWPGSSAGKDAEAHYHSCMKKVHEWGENRRRAEAESRAEAEKARHRAASRRFHEMQNNGEALAWLIKELSETRVEFEVGGWDVCIHAPRWIGFGLFIELKPQMGDDYAAVLRTLKMRDARFYRRALIVDRFAAEGASLDDVRWIFQQSGIVVRTLSEIRAARPVAKASE